MYNPYPGYANSYPPSQQYPPEYNQGYGYPGGYGYQQNPPPLGAPLQGMPPAPGYSNNGWQQQQGMYNNPPPKPEEPKSEGVLNEMEQQKNQLLKQREDYVRKCAVLRRELEQLRQQKQELISDGHSEREHKVILKENERLQEEIQGKMKAILNVIEMLSSIIKDGKKIDDLEAELEEPKVKTPEPKREPSAKPSRDWESSEIRHKSRSPVRSLTPKHRNSKEYSRERESEKDKESREKRFNYTYYDTGMHWCRSCDKFPETAKEYLQHLHSDEHQALAKENEVDITPWHKLPLEPVLPSYDDAPKKRLPIKGLQFFVSAPSWYCKLCDTWIGDLHCASHHLKSLAHSQNYENFVEQNPHWETEWLKDREKSMGRRGKNDSDSDHGSKKRKKDKRAFESFLKDKKKKKRSKKKKKHSSSGSSSSSSSESSSSDEDNDEKEDDDDNDKSKSIRVAMRNVPQVKSIMSEDMSKWNVLEKLLQEHQKNKERESREREHDEDNLINQWMTIVEPPQKDQFETLKDRMRAKQEVEKAKAAEYERRRREKEREARELLERRRQKEREEIERLEYERRRKDEEEYHKIVDKDRNQVRFRASRDHYRRRRIEESDDDEYHKSRDKKRHIRESPPPSRYRKEKENESHSRSREDNNDHAKPMQHHSPEPKEEPKKKPPGPPSYKKLPFIGRMPLYKIKKAEKAKPAENKELKQEEYEPQRKSKFETGNLAKSFIPQPDVVCFPKLSSVPPLDIPPPPVEAPAPPKIDLKSDDSEENVSARNGPDVDPDSTGQYYEDIDDMPLPPPPRPPPYPQDDLSMLGISVDDITAQIF